MKDFWTFENVGIDISFGWKEKVEKVVGAKLF